MVYCIVLFVNCMILYMPHNFFHERKYNSTKEILLATCTCIYIAPTYLLFKFDEFYISKGAFFRFLSQFLTQLCEVYLNKEENNNSIISTT